MANTLFTTLHQWCTLKGLRQRNYAYLHYAWIEVNNKNIHLKGFSHDLLQKIILLASHIQKMKFTDIFLTIHWVFLQQISDGQNLTTFICPMPPLRCWASKIGRTRKKYCLLDPPCPVVQLVGWANCLDEVDSGYGREFKTQDILNNLPNLVTLFSFRATECKLYFLYYLLKSWQN